MVEKFKNLIALSIIGAGIIVAGAFFYQCQEKEGLTGDQAAEKAINFINQNLVAEGLNASLVSVAEENGVYKVHFKVKDKEYDSYVTKNGKLLFLQSFDLKAKPAPSPKPETPKGKTIGNFSISQDEICREEGKPIVYFFGSKRCPHCNWEHPIVEEVAQDFKGYISFHNNMDSDADQDIFRKYSTGGIPTLVLGCKYFRVGSGETIGQEKESKVLRALICKLTGSQPAEICAKIQDLIDQIE